MLLVLGFLAVGLPLMWGRPRVTTPPSLPVSPNLLFAGGSQKLTEFKSPE